MDIINTLLKCSGSRKACRKFVQDILEGDSFPSDYPVSSRFWAHAGRLFRQKNFYTKQLEFEMVEWAEGINTMAEAREASAMSLCEEAKGEEVLFTLFSLLEVDPKVGPRGIARALRGLPWQLPRSKKGWETHPEESRITFKRGVDFRSAAPYLFVRLDGKEVLGFWPYPGARSNWLD